MSYKVILNKCNSTCPKMKGINVDDCIPCIKKAFKSYFNDNKNLDTKSFINELLADLKKYERIELSKHIVNGSSSENILNPKLY